MVSSCPQGRVHFMLAGGESHHLTQLRTFPHLSSRDLPGQAAQSKPALSSGALSSLNPSHYPKGLCAMMDPSLSVLSYTGAAHPCGFQAPEVWLSTTEELDF